MARNGSSKEEIKAYIEREFHYDLSRTLDNIRTYYHHVESCQEMCIRDSLYTDVTIAVKNGFKSFFTGRLCKELSVSYVLYEEISVSYTHLDVYKRQSEGYGCYTIQTSCSTICAGI